MESKIIIRRATMDDSQNLTELAYQTYWDTFHAHPENDPKDFADYMQKAFDLEQIETELKDKNSIFIVAEIENKMVGYAKLEIFKTEPPIKGKQPIELNRLYARQDYIGKGIGIALMNECLKISKEMNFDVIWLGVWELNPRAIRFYEKCGFRPVGSHIFQMGSDRQTDILMQKEI